MQTFFISKASEKKVEDRDKLFYRNRMNHFTGYRRIQLPPDGFRKYRIVPGFARFVQCQSLTEDVFDFRLFFMLTSELLFLSALTDGLR